MTVSDFFDKHNGKGIDFDKSYGFQCMDVYQQFNTEVVGAPTVACPAAKDVWTNYPTKFYTKISNTPTNFPTTGDVVVWGTGVGQYGHIAVCKEASSNSFISMDQNWPLNVDANGNGLGVCHFQSHNYNSVLGWLRPKSLPDPVEPSTPAVDPDQVQIDLGAPWGTQKVFQIKSTLSDNARDLDSQKKTIADQTLSLSQMTTQIKDMADNRAKLADKLGCADDSSVILGEVQKLVDTEDQHNGIQPSGIESLISALLNIFKKK